MSDHASWTDMDLYLDHVWSFFIDWHGPLPCLILPHGLTWTFTMSDLALWTDMDLYNVWSCLIEGQWPLQCLILPHGPTWTFTMSDLASWTDMDLYNVWSCLVNWHELYEVWSCQADLYHIWSCLMDKHRLVLCPVLPMVSLPCLILPCGLTWTVTMFRCLILPHELIMLDLVSNLTLLFQSIEVGRPHQQKFFRFLIIK